MPKVHETGSAGGGRRRGRGNHVSTTLSEINVVPLVDVMLVLLVIFMVAAPLMKQGFPVQLPQSKESMPLKVSPLTVSVPRSFRKDQRVRIEDESVPLSTLAERLKQAMSDRAAKDVVLSMDGDVTAQEMTTVFDRLRQAGISNVGIQTQPPVGREP